MPKFRHSELLRSGQSQNKWGFPQKLNCSASTRGNTLELKFSITAGSGVSDILLKVNEADILMILNELANNIPEAIILSDCTSVASKKILAELKKREILT